MNCFECTTMNDTVFGCGHDLPRAKPLRGVPAGIAATGRQSSADVT